ncbi:hypothetical protein [Paludisphaera sp.]
MLGYPAWLAEARPEREIRPIAPSIDAFPDVLVEWWREVERRGS